MYYNRFFFFFNFTQINRFYPLVWVAMTAINHANLFYSKRKKKRKENEFFFVTFSRKKYKIVKWGLCRMIFVNNNLMKLFQQYQQ